MRQYSERTLLLLLAAVQFTHILDFMVMMPLGQQLMRDLTIGPAQFSHLVAAYTISAGVVGFLTAPFMDRHDRKKILLVVYAGFALGTLACGLSHNATQLLIARAVCGAFGGVSGATIMSILSDIVPPQRRAAGMGVIMAAFAVAAALGVPIGLYLAQKFRWEMPFLLVAGMAAIIWVLITIILPPVRGHLEETASHGFHTFWELLRDPNAGRALIFMSALVMGHITIIPLLAPYLVSNVGMPEDKLFLIYLIGGVCSAFTAPLFGKMADRRGHMHVYTFLIVVACVVTLMLTNAPQLPVWAVLILAAGFFTFASGRFVPAQAIVSLAVPARRRGSFMSLSSCTRDLTTGFTTSLGGWIVTKAPSGQLVNYSILGWIAVGVSLFSLWLAKRVQANEIHQPAFTSPSAAVE
ncbi:MAG TPA: MFS transporter [Verrucomicrobiae bacterium]|nr:MFS transporter [Verrucomicrobiae bacterium]